MTKLFCRNNNNLRHARFLCCQQFGKLQFIVEHSIAIHLPSQILLAVHCSMTVVQSIWTHSCIPVLYYFPSNFPFNALEFGCTRMCHPELAPAPKTIWAKGVLYWAVLWQWTVLFETKPQFHRLCAVSLFLSYLNSLETDGSRRNRSMNSARVSPVQFWIPYPIFHPAQIFSKLLTFFHNVINQ